MIFVIATNNKKKLIELERILKPLGIEAKSAKELNVSLDDVEETETTFEGNARLKAVAGCKKTGYPAVADDSGLMVDALNGAPGIYSARYAGEDATDIDRNNKLLSELKQVPQDKRGCKYVSAISCYFPDGRELVVRGECFGSIGYEPKGENGFGYDPIFLVQNDSQNRTMAQLSNEDKDLISHRGKALKELAQKLPSYLK